MLPILIGTRVRTIPAQDQRIVLVVKLAVLANQTYDCAYLSINSQVLTFQRHAGEFMLSCFNNNHESRNTKHGRRSCAMQSLRANAVTTYDSERLSAECFHNGGDVEVCKSMEAANHCHPCEWPAL